MTYTHQPLPNQIIDKSEMKKFHSLLCCPETKADLVEHNNQLISVDENSRRAYRIEDGIPVLLIEESVKLDKATWEQILTVAGKK